MAIFSTKVILTAGAGVALLGGALAYSTNSEDDSADDPGTGF